MKRDGTNTSIWQHEEENFTSSKHNLPANSPVVVVGGGITGVTTALLLQLAGKPCVLLEAQSLCFGTTSATTAHINTFPEIPWQDIVKNFNEEDASMVAEAFHNSSTLIHEMINKYKIDCDYEQLPGFVFATDEKQLKELDELVEYCKKFKVPAHYTESFAFPVPHLKMAEFPKQAKFHPVKYVKSLAKIFENAGGKIIQNCRVLDFDVVSDLVDVETTLGKINTQFLIFATHIPIKVNWLHFRCAPWRSYVVGFKMKQEYYSKALVYDMNDPYKYYRTARIGDEQFFIVGGEDAKTGHDEDNQERFLKLESHVRTFFDVEQVAFKWSSEYFTSTDGLPYIGKLPGQDGNVFVATGYGGNGMNYGTFSAMLFEKLITLGDSRYVKLFDPNRIKPVAGFSNFLKQAADVTANLVGGLFHKEKLEALVDLAPGEGKVVDYEGKKMGLYKDEAGGLHAVDTTCTHVKCTVHWNGIEKSWDCPCHGSRFSVDGQVLTGPATKNLNVFSLAELASSHK